MEGMAFGVIAIVCLVLAVISYAVSAGCKIYEKNKNSKMNEIYGETEDNNADVVTEPQVTVLSKSSTVNAEWKITINQVVFQTKDKTRICLAIRDENQFQTLMEGDTGTLVFQDKKFISFTLS